MARLAIDEDHQMKRLLRRLMISELHKDPTVCEQCGKVGKTAVHHTKYEGCTLYDLLFLCQKCNCQRYNKGLV